jgi:uncharacterized protein
MDQPKLNIDIKKDIQLRDGVLIHGFPGPGLASAIAINYVMDQLELPRIGTMSSEVFPALAVVRDYVPGHPMRFYGKDGLLLLISEMAPMDALARLISDNLIKFSRENGIRTVISLEAIVQQQMPQQNPTVEGADDGGEVKEPEVFVVASTEKLKDQLEEKGLKLFKEGMITGVAGLLLSEGERLGIDIICILTEANPMFPDARAATRMLEELTKIESLDLDLDKLEKQAEEIEEKVKDSMMQAQKYLEAQQKQGQQPTERVVPAHMYG